MKVLHVVIDGELAGGQQIALRLACGAREHGHDAVFVSPSPGPFLAAVEEAGFRSHLADISRLNRIDGLGRLVNVLRAEQPDIVATHAMVAVNVLARCAARLGRVQIVHHAHAIEVFRPGFAGALYRSIDRTTAGWCAAVVAVSEYVRRDLCARGWRSDSITVIHNGFDPPSRRPPPPEGLPRLPAGRTVACVGRLEPAKGQADLLRAVASLHEVIAVLVGRDVGGHRAELERLAEELGIADRVVFTGVRDDVLSVLAAVDLLVLPSHAEGFPLVPLEAMAVARPVVATRIGGTPELVADGETGLLVAPKDVDALAAALGSLLDDPAYAAALGVAGLHRLRDRFSASEMVERTLAVYEAALRPRRC